MRLSMCLGLVVATLLAGCPDPEGPNGPQPPVVDNGDPTTRPDDLLSIDDVLENLEEAGRVHTQITADVTYYVDQQMTGDTELRTGTVKFLRAGEQTPSKFDVRFETLKMGAGATLRDTVEYAFDGRWLTIAKFRIEQMTRFEVAAEGETVDAFKLGEGPFPLPFGQEADAMRETFEITMRPPRADEPAGTDCLILIPRDQYKEDIAFTRIELWVDRSTGLPARILSHDKSRNVTTVTFADIDTDVELTDSDFHLPRRLGWEYNEHRLDQN